jgi:septal ring factor EnvC (AmiA/AmiB activator)
MSFPNEDDNARTDELFFLSNTAKFQLNQESLLAKCKETIEELVGEIDSLKREKSDVEEKLLRAHGEMGHQSAIIKDLRQKEDSLACTCYYGHRLTIRLGEVQELRHQNQSLRKSSLLEAGSLMRSSDVHHSQVQDLADRFRKDMIEKNKQIDDLERNLKAKDTMIIEWNSSMGVISSQIKELEEENQQLTEGKLEIEQEYEKQAENMRTLQRNYETLKKQTKEQLDDLTNIIRDQQKEVSHCQRQ